MFSAFIIELICFKDLDNCILWCIYSKIRGGLIELRKTEGFFVSVSFAGYFIGIFPVEVSNYIYNPSKTSCVIGVVHSAHFLL